MNDLEASLGSESTSKIKNIYKKDNLLQKDTSNYFKNLPIKFQKIDTKNYSSYHLFVICINLKNTKKKYNYIFEYLRRKKIGVNKNIICQCMVVHITKSLKNIKN